MLCWQIEFLKKKATGKSPFELVYGLDVTLLVHLKLPAYQLLQHFSTDKDVVQKRIDHIVELDETHRKALDNVCKNQSNINKSFAIISGDLSWDTKSSNDLIFNEIHNNLFSGIISRNGFYPFSEIISSSYVIFLLRK